MKVLFTNGNHYSLLIKYSDDIGEINNNVKYKLNENFELGNIPKLKNNLNINPKKLCILEKDPTYYDKIFEFLKSLDNAKNKNNNLIDWKKIVYPENIFTLNDDKRKRNKKLKILEIDVNIIN